MAELGEISRQPLSSVEQVLADDEHVEASPTGLMSLVTVARQHGIHLSVPQLIHDNQLREAEVSPDVLLKCARQAGLKARSVKLSTDDLFELEKVLPAIVCLRHGGYMLLLRVETEASPARIVLQDPLADEDALLVVDQLRFEQIWAGQTLLVKRDYDIRDEQQPFGLGLITALIFRERRMVRDVAICAIALGFLALAPLLFWRILADRVLPYKALNTLYVASLGLFALIIFETIFTWVRRYLVLLLTTRVDVKLSIYLFDKLLNLPMEFFERTQIGKIAHDINELWKIRTFLIGQLFGTILNSTTLLFFIPVMFFFSPILTFVVLGIAGLIALWMIVTLPIYRKKSAAATAAAAQRGAFLIQSLNGIRTIKSLALEARQRHQWDVQVARFANLNLAAGLTANWIQAVVLPLERLAVSASFALGVYFAITADEMYSIGALFIFILLSRRVVAPLMQIAQLINQYDEARLAVEVVRKLINQPGEEGREQGVRTPIKGNIEVAGLSFKYKGAGSLALDKVSFEIPAGGRLGVVGRSGSGKTTLTRLLQRLHSDYEGVIKVDGIDVREYDLTHLRQNTGVVLQDNFLFTGTIRENIAIAKPDASFDDVVRAARMAGAEEFIDRLPRGYETYIYEGSPNLSGGQRQRLAIARALIVDPPILIFDEATSALDPESEAIVNANLGRIAHSRTMLVVSHRLASLMFADAILVLDQGRVVDVGTHQQLLERCEVYRRLWNEQNSHVLKQPERGLPNSRKPSLVS